MKLIEGLTALGILRRLLASLRSVSRSLESLAQTQALQLKLDLLKTGASMDDLLAAEDEEGPGEVVEQTPEELIELADLEEAAEARGDRVGLDDDLTHLEWLRANPDEREDH